MRLGATWSAGPGEADPSALHLVPASDPKQTLAQGTMNDSSAPIQAEHGAEMSKGKQT